MTWNATTEGAAAPNGAGSSRSEGAGSYATDGGIRPEGARMQDGRPEGAGMHATGRGGAACAHVPGGEHTTEGAAGARATRGATHNGRARRNEDALQTGSRNGNPKSTNRSRCGNS